MFVLLINRFLREICLLCLILATNELHHVEYTNIHSSSSYLIIAGGSSASTDWLLLCDRYSRETGSISMRQTANQLYGVVNKQTHIRPTIIIEADGLWWPHCIGRCQWCVVLSATATVPCMDLPRLNEHTIKTRRDCKCFQFLKATPNLTRLYGEIVANFMPQRLMMPHG